VKRKFTSWDPLTLMFDIDPRLQSRLRQQMKRVLILEENPAYARMLADMLRILGSDNIVVETDDRKAMSLVDDLEPQLILCEYKTAKIDGIGFTKELRRSGGKCKQVPVIMVKADLTPVQLTEARNSGVHEMMCKPFAWQDLLKRLQNVLFKPRQWIEVATYTGPDRRRFNTGEYSGAKKRRGEVAVALKSQLDAAVTSLHLGLGDFDIDTTVALQNVMTQMAVLVPACKTVKDPRFINAVTAVVGDLRNKTLTKASLAPQIAALAQSLNLDKLEVGRGDGEVLILAAEAGVAAA
jgi:two-component system, response regulator PdtaR